MGTGILSINRINQIDELTRNIKGDYAEIGVFIGNTFKKWIPIVQRRNVIAHAFDSFVGMNNPTEEDGLRYPKGRFDIGGENKFIERMNRDGISKSIYKTHVGFVPDCFKDCDDLKFFCVYIDLDHNKPTDMAFDWAWPKLNVNGILVFDDYWKEPPFPESSPRFAIDRCLAKIKYEEIFYENNSIAIRKI